MVPSCPRIRASAASFLLMPGPVGGRVEARSDGGPDDCAHPQQRSISMTDTEAMRTRLEHSLAELRARQAHVTQELAEPPHPDSAERAVETEDDQALEGQAELVGREIASVRRALER